MTKPTIYTVTLNPALDCFISPERFAAGDINRYGEGTFFPGGKGVNVSLMLAGLGAETMALGFCAGFTGRELAALLDAAGCPNRFIMLPEGLTRINIKITPRSGPETALNGESPAIPEEALAQLEKQISGLAAGDWLVLAGSVPGSLPRDVYARLMGAAPDGVQVVVDTSGPALTEAVKAGSFLVKPNLEELGEMFGTDILPEQAPDYARRLQEMGARNVAVSMGGGGALLLTQGGDILCREALPGQEVSSVGAGDSFVAGFLYGWIKTSDYEQAMDWAMAAGAATAFTQGIAGGEQVRALHGAGR